MLLATAVRLKAAGYPQKHHSRRVKPVWVKRDDGTWEDRGCVYFPTADELVLQLPEITGINSVTSGVVVSTDGKSVCCAGLSDALAELWIIFNGKNANIIPQGVIK